MRTTALGGKTMRRTVSAMKHKANIIKAAALALLVAAVTALIVLAANGKLFGSEADEVYDSFYAVESAQNN